MAYRVFITASAKMRLDEYIWYTAKVLKNPIAARRIREDARITKKLLSETAEIPQILNNPTLAQYGYRKFRFQEHGFVMIYRIDGNMVIIEGMFHELQDYESVFIDELNL